LTRRRDDTQTRVAAYNRLPGNMLSLLTPLSIGAAASAVSSVAGAIPTPGDFATALSRASDKGESAKGADAVTPPDAIATATAKSPDELRRLLRDIEKSLAKMLGRNSVDNAKPVRLKLAGQDGVQVDGTHPDAAKINELLSGDKELSASIAKALRSINAATSPELMGVMSAGGARVGEPTLTLVDGMLSASLG
jgi:hypothetical protein